MSKSLFMESTEITPEKTITEIEAVLIQYGATAVLKEYANGTIEAVSFRVKVSQIEIPFRLPCRYQEMAQMFRKRAKIPDHAWTSANSWDSSRRRVIEQKARRVAWRQILRWVQAQLALVETSMVKIEEVFFPYIQAKGGQTLYELHVGNLLALPSGNGESA